MIRTKPQAIEPGERLSSLLRENFQPLPYGCERGRSWGVQLLPQAGEHGGAVPSGGGFGSGVQQDSQGVAEPLKDARTQDRLIAKREQTLRRSVSRCPARLPLSTVETYLGDSGFRDCVSYQL